MDCTGSPTRRPGDGYAKPDGLVEGVRSLSHGQVHGLSRDFDG